MSGESPFKRRKLGDGDSSDSIGPAINRRRFPLQNGHDAHGSGRNTPRSGRDTSRSGRNTPRQHEFDTPEPGVGDEDEMALDRDWYGGEENGHAFGDETHNPFGGADNTWYDQQREEALAVKKKATAGRMSARSAQHQRDTDAWEANRMLTSGVAMRTNYAGDFED